MSVEVDVDGTESPRSRSTSSAQLRPEGSRGVPSPRVEELGGVGAAGGAVPLGKDCAEGSASIASKGTELGDAGLELVVGGATAASKDALEVTARDSHEDPSIAVGGDVDADVMVESATAANRFTN